MSEISKEEREARNYRFKIANKYVAEHGSYQYNQVYVDDNGYLISDDTHRDIQEKKELLRRTKYGTA